MKGELGFGIVSNYTPKSFYTWGLFDAIIATDDGKPYLPFAQSLLQGEQFVKISRQKIFRQGEQTEAISIFFYQGVDSSKAGAYIGSAFAFTAQPTQLFLSNTVKAFHTNVLTNQELLEDSTTVPLRFINFPTDDLLMGTPISGKTVTQLGVYSVFVGGTLLDYILPLVQGFMYNPNFQQLQTLYASDNKELLKRIHGGEEDNILGIEQVLNFNRYFREHTEKLEKLRREYAELEEKTRHKSGKETAATGANAFKIRSADEKEKLNHEIAVLKKKLYASEEELKKRNEFYIRLNEKIYSAEKEGDEKLQQLRDESNRVSKELEDKKRISNKLEQETLSLQDQHKEWEQKNSRAKDIIKKLEEKQKAIKESNYTDFKSLLNAPHFKEEKLRYDNENPNIMFLRNEISALKAKGKKGNKVSVRKRLSIIGLCLLCFIVGLLINTNKNQINVHTLNLPKEYSVKDFLALSHEEKEKHKSELDKAISRLSSSPGNISKPSKDSLLHRKWNIGELFDPENFDQEFVLPGTERVTEIKKLYKNHSIPTDIFDLKGGLFELSPRLIVKEFMFDSNAYYDFIREYLRKEDNAYRFLQLRINSSFYEEGFDANLTSKDIQSNELLLYMHFRLMLYRLNGENIHSANKRTYLIPFIEREQEIEKLYNVVSEIFDIGTYEEFLTKMDTPEKRRSFYNVVSSKGYDLGNYAEYERRLSK